MLLAAGADKEKASNVSTRPATPSLCSNKTHYHLLACHLWLEGDQVEAGIWISVRLAPASPAVEEQRAAIRANESLPPHPSTL